jgi:hypothetical protein
MDNKQIPKPARYSRSCGHPSDWTLDLKRLDGVIESYCLGCIIDKLGLKPVARFRLQVDGKNVKIIPVEE